MRKLTQTQTRVLEFIQERAARDGRSPTHDEIASNFGWRSAFSVRQHLSLLEKKGALVREKGKARSVRLRHSRSNLTIPMLGLIPAGPLTEAIETEYDPLKIPEGMFRGKRLFALRVNGDSMKCAGINHGDIAVIDSQPEVLDGEIAAIRHRDETTLKRIFRTASGILLKAENPDFENITISANEAEDCQIAGRLVGVIRDKI